MRIISILAATLALAQPALAQDASFTVSLAGRVPASCTTSDAAIRPISGVNSTTPVANGGSGSTAIQLNTGSNQQLGIMNVRCNTPTTRLDVSTANGFKLVNPDQTANNAIPYRLSVAQSGGISQSFTAAGAATIPNTGPAANQPYRLGVVVPVVDPTTLWAGAYSDVVQLTLSPIE